MVTVNGETFPVSSIVRIEGNYIYTSNYMKIYATKEEMEEVLEKMQNLTNLINFRLEFII